MRLFEMKMWVKIFCGVCQRTGTRTILYVERDQSRKVLIGCEKCHGLILQLVLFPKRKWTVIAKHPETRVTVDNFSLIYKTI